MLAMDDKVLLKAVKGNVFTEIDGEAAILNTTSGKYYGLNETGTFVWDLIQESIRFEKIIRAVISNFDVKEEECKHDLEQLLRDLSKEGLVILKKNEND